MLVDLVVAAGLIKTPVIRSDTLREIPLPLDLKNKLGQTLGCTVGEYSSFKDTSDGNLVVFPNQYFRFAVELYDFSQELIKYFEYADKIRDLSLPFFSSNRDADKASIVTELKADKNASSIFYPASDLDRFAEFIEDIKDCPARLEGKGFINRPNKLTRVMSIRGSKDCFGSVILTRINTANVSSTTLGDLIYLLAREPELYNSLKEFYESQTIASGDESVLDRTEHIELAKPFVLLAGISGTGKSRFVVEQSVAQGPQGSSEYYQLVAVRPDWHEPSDLLGYVSRISGEKFITTPFLTFMGKAWRAAISSATIDGFKLKDLDQIPTFWACLDEMNLAPVEQYFADFLAILETRKWESGEYSCLPIFSPKHLMLTKVEALDEVARDLGFDPSDGMWSYITEHGMPLPPNLIVAGTVNMDETAHGFSRKVIDRAITIDFGEFYPNNFDDYFDPIVSNKIFKFPRRSSIEKSELSTILPDPDGARTIAFLEKINGEGLLKNTPFELAYRALNELLLSVKCFDPQSDIELFSIWDDFLMTKLLPRIEGDSDKLISRREGSAHDMDQNTLLTDLLEELKAQFKVAENMLRPDLFRTDIANSAMPIEIEFRTLKKLAWMQRRLSRDRFTSFWP